VKMTESGLFKHPLRNLSSELLEIPTRNGILLSFGVTNTRAAQFLIKSACA
jgi:hypothetical protein